MANRWSCFLSFRRGKGELASGILELFAKTLENELDLQVDLGVYRYPAEMVAGDFVDPTIASELVASTCMVMLFTGNYFSRKHTYCAREYLLMNRLEAVRLGPMLPDTRRKKGLIVPVIVRNPERVPAELKGRYWFDFTGFAEDASGITKPERFFGDIRKIADYIAARYYELDGVIDDDGPLDLPGDDDVQAFLGTVEKSLKPNGKPTKKKR
jgi:hypothetical protein